MHRENRPCTSASKTNSLRVGLRIALLATALTLAFSAQAQNYSVIYTLHGGLDGAFPYAGVTMDRAGNLYGTTAEGGTPCGYYPGCGVVFQLTHRADGWTVNSLHVFTGGNDGAYPVARVVFGPDGTLYGTTSIGGGTTCPINYDVGCGTVFNLRPPATVCRSALCSWNENVIYRFQGGSDGSRPLYGDLTFDSHGNMFGTTFDGGGVPSCYNDACGTVFEVSPSQGGWEEQVIHSFNSDGGYWPSNSVIFDSAGNLYGATSNSPYGGAVVFELTPDGGNWSISTVGQFSNSSQDMQGGLLFDQGGNLYGATTGGGAYGGGIAFEFSPQGNGWNLNTLYNFGQGQSASGPLDTLVMDSAGNLYGTASSGGQYGYGAVFKLTPSQGSWTYASLHDFTGGSDGASPQGQVILDASGNIFGTAVYGGAVGSCNGDLGCGVVFEITP